MAASNSIYFMRTIAILLLFNVPYHSCQSDYRCDFNEEWRVESKPEPLCIDGTFHEAEISNEYKTGCFCRRGYVRVEKTRKCITIFLCPPNVYGTKDTINAEQIDPWIQSTLTDGGDVWSLWEEPEYEQDEWDDSWNPTPNFQPIGDSLLDYETSKEFFWDDVNFSWDESGNPWGDVITPWGDEDSIWDELDYPNGTLDQYGAFGYIDQWDTTPNYRTEPTDPWPINLMKLWGDDTQQQFKGQISQEIMSKIPKTTLLPDLEPRNEFGNFLQIEPSNLWVEDNYYPVFDVLSDVENMAIDENWNDMWNPPKNLKPLNDTMFAYDDKYEFSWNDINFSWGEPGNPWGEVIAPWGDEESAWDEIDYPYGTNDEFGDYGYGDPWVFDGIVWGAGDVEWWEAVNKRWNVGHYFDGCFKSNELYKTSGDLEPTCVQPNPQNIKQRTGCFCRAGYVRDSENNCIPYENCPQINNEPGVVKREEPSCQPGKAYKKGCDVCICQLNDSEDSCTKDRNCQPGESSSDTDDFECFPGDLYVLINHVCYCNEDGAGVTCEDGIDSPCDEKNEVFEQRKGDSYCNPYGDSIVTASSDWSEYGCYCMQDYARNYFGDCVQKSSCDSFRLK